MLKREKKTFKVEFTTAFPRSPYVYIVLEAKDTHHASWVARNLCRFGFISHVTTTDAEPTYTEDTHDWAYDEDYEVYSWLVGTEPALL